MLKKPNNFKDQNNDKLDLLKERKIVKRSYLSTGSIISNEKPKALSKSAIKKALTRKLLSYIENAPSAVFIADAKGNYVRVNKAATDITGYPMSALLKMNLIELVHPMDRDKAVDSFHNLLKEGQSSSEGRFLTKMGEEKFWNVSAIKINDDTYLAVVHDITARKKIEKEFMDQKLELENFFRLSPNMLCIIEKDFSFRKTSSAWQQILGYTSVELTKKNYLDLVHPEDVEHIREAMVLLSSEQPQFNDRIRIRCFNGSYIWAEWNYIKNGDLIFGIGTNIDNMLFYEDELKKAKETAEAKSTAKSDFLANMSHEIRNPMNAIIGFTELLYNKIKDEKQRVMIDAIRKSGKVLLNLINDILDLSKIEAGKMNFQFEPVNLNFVLKDIEIMFGQKIREKGLSFCVDTEVEPSPNLMLDEFHLKQVIFNLISNALKFTDKGFISLKVSREIKSRTKIDLIITVQDTGIGIPLEQQKLIFEAFHQQEKQNAKKYGGTGLGLSISKRLVEMMDGEIIVISEKDKGSIFKVVLHNVEIQQPEESEIKQIYCVPDECTIENAKEEAIHLSEDQKDKLVKVIDVLEKDFLPVNEYVIKKQLIEQIELFGTELRSLGKVYGLALISEYGKKVCQYAASFEIDNMMKTLRSFPDLIETIKLIRFS